VNVQLLAALGTLALLTVLPGPDVAVVTRVSLASGRRAAFGAALGIATGCLVWGLLTAAGLAALLATSATAFTVVKLAGAGYLIWLGLQAWWSTRRPAGSTRTPTVLEPVTLAAGEAPTSEARRSSAQSLASAWRTGLVANLLNPKIGVFYTSLLPQLVPSGWPTAETVIGLVLAHDVMGLLWLNGYALMLHRARGTLNRPQVRRALDRLTGSALIGFGLRVALQRH
jgi:threonine/homoserine/homoserine lactone efflux protein